MTAAALELIRAREDRAVDAGHLATEEGRVLERQTDGADGQRRYRVRLINSGESLNKRYYPEAVLHAAAPMYEGARVFDGHRTDASLAQSAVGGLVGTVHTIEAVTGGVDGTLELLNTDGGRQVAAVLDASLAAEALHRPPLAGLSHDVLMETRRTSGGLQEAVKINRVLSVDVVADPAAGGRAQRALAGGLTVKTLRDLLDALAKCKDDDARKALAASDEAKGILEAAGFTAEQALSTVASELSASSSGDGKTDPSAKTDPPAGDPPAAAKADPPAGDPPASSSSSEPVDDRVAAAMMFRADSLIGRALLREATHGMAPELASATIAQAPAVFTEAQLRAHVEGVRAVARAFEAAGATSRVGETRGAAVTVTDELDRKLEALDAMFVGSPAGYRTVKEAWLDICHPGERIGFLDGSDLSKRFMREANAGYFDSGDRPVQIYTPCREAAELKAQRQRAVESMLAVTGGAAARGIEALISSSWNLVLGDAVTRRMVAAYQLPQLDSWRRVVSNVQNIADFRTQRIDRIGGYAVPLPTVNESAAYQPLTSPTNEEVTYAVSKRGGTESVTLEMIANDDMRAVQQIPTKLARTAALTLYRFVWDSIVTNPVIYDSVNLFAAGHNNATTTALSTTAVEASRAQMRRLAAYGNTAEILGLTPRYLITGSTLETLAWQICTSAVALPSAAPVGAAANNPNIHQGMTPLVLDYLTSQTAWFLIADPATCPTLEVGFLNGRDTPELFTQNDPTVGSMFNNDTVTYKIRHIYGAAVLDYRAMSRGNT